jgi:hypothetical protein
MAEQKEQMNPSEFFFKLGGTLRLIGVGGTVLILILHWLGAINAEHFPWRFFGLFFDAGGLAPFIFGGVWFIWEN